MRKTSFHTIAAALVAGALTVAASPALAGTATRAAFGALPDGSRVEAVTLDNGHGLRARILSYGAILQSLEVPDRAGRPADIVLGYADAASYVTHPNYFGASVGRYANRIAGGRFTIDGRAYQLPLNNGPNSLHGGPLGFDKRIWRIVSVQGGAEPNVTLAYVSADGEQGYPGTLSVTATYTLAAGALRVDYRATTNAPTIVNITNHSFFNLAGEASAHNILDERLTIPAETITPVGSTLIPTGAFRRVAGTPFDFRAAATIGVRIRDGRDEQIRFGQGYDHNYVVTRAPTRDLHLMARVEDPASGRVMELLSNQPGVQFYAGNFLDGTAIGKSGHAYRQSDGLALEPQVFPDTPNQPAFGTARLDPGQTYENHILYRFSTTRR
jgi:aldose 1-epimerase